ncbi:hypothetical protein F4801DRAFT_532843 [Xylaria longipes]|nr:hypothetical protein F4801DRAFT_532843 [Xylaria longipes]
MAMTPQLPPELYLLIIEFITDSNDLSCIWLNFRRVSREFKAITESVFVRKHLAHTRIEFPAITRRVYDKDDNEHWRELILHFETLTGINGERAVFSQKREEYHASTRILLGYSNSDDEDNNTLYKHVTTLWRECFYGYSLPAPKTAFATPPHVLSVRRVVNDTALPGLEVNWEEHTISVLWKEMLTALFGEEEYLKQVEANEIREYYEKEGGFEALAERIRAGDREALRFMTLASGTDMKRRRMVRKKRFRRWYENHTDLDVEEQPDNPGKVKILRDYQVGMNLVIFDDESGNNSDE